MNGTGPIGLAATFLVVAAAAGACARGLQYRGRRWWVLAAAVVALSVAATMGREVWQRTVALDLAALSAVAMVWTDTDFRGRRAARVFLQLMVVAIASVGAAQYGLSAGAVSRHASLVVGLFAVGYGVKLALVPFCAWLPGVARRAAPLTTVLIVSVVDVAALGELARLRTEAPWVFTDFRAAWLALAGLSMLGGALLALAQADVKQMLAFSTIDDMGYLLLGVVAGPGAGLAGALAGAMVHSLSKMLLFGAVAVTERGLHRPVTLRTRGLAARFPVSAAAFIVGALAAVGMPPTLGFAGRSRLYLAGLTLGGPWLLSMMLAATALGVIYYARAIHAVWLGAPDARDVAEPRLAVLPLLVLSVAVVGLGVVPLW